MSEPTTAEAPERSFNFNATAGKLASRLSDLVSDAAERDRAKLAALRRGLGKPGGWDAQAASIVSPIIGDVPYRQQEEIYFHVAALFALHPVSRRTMEDDRRPVPLTQALRQHVEQLPGNFDDNFKPYDRRVMAMLNADRADVIHHLRHAIGQLRGSETIGVDWARLMIDLHHWDDPDRNVQRRWARAWWTTPAREFAPQ